MCEEFGIALVEGGAIEQPLKTTTTIIRLRDYAKAKTLCESADTSEKMALVPQWAQRLYGKVLERRLDWQEAHEQIPAED